MSAPARPSVDRPSSTSTKALGPEDAKSRKSEPSGTAREAPKTRTVRAIGMPAPRQRPIGLVLGVGFFAMAFVGILAGLLRFQFPVPLVFSILGALGVGYSVAFAAGGRGSGVNQINLGMAFVLGAFAAFLSWATLYKAVSWSLYNFAVKIVDTVESEEGTDGHVGGQNVRTGLKNGFENQFAFATFVRLRSASSDQLNEDVNKLTRGMLLSGNSSTDWWKNHRFVLKRCNGSFEIFSKWTADQFNNKFRGSVRIKGSALEGAGVVHSVLWIVEIVIAGALATLVYFRVCSAGVAKPED